MRFPGGSLLFAAMAGCAVAVPGELTPYRVEGDAIPAPLASAAGDPARGKAVVMGRESNCLLCHAIPETGVRFMGNIGPQLSGIGSQLSAGQLRLRIVDQSRLNHDTVMPSYYRLEGLTRVAQAYQGKPVLTAGQIEDVVAFLQTLQ